MRTVSILLPLTLLAAAVAAPAQAETKLAVIRTQVILRDAPQVRDADQKLKAEFAAREKDLQGDGKKLEDDIRKFQRDADTMSPTQRTTTQNDLNTRKTNFDIKQREFQEQAQNRNQELRRDVLEKVNTAIEQVAKDQNIDIVLQDPAYANNALDVTDEVLKKLTAMGISAAPPAGVAKKKKKLAGRRVDADAMTTLGELAQRFGAGMPELELAGDPSTPIRGTCGLDPGEPGCITFLNNPRYRPALARTQAAAVILGRRDAAGFKGNALVVKDPYLAYARIAAVFDRSDDFAPGVHASASVDPSAKVGKGSLVGAAAVVMAGAVIGDNAYIGPGCVIGRNASIGDGGRLQGNIFVGDRVRIGRRARISAGAVIGSRGFGLARGPQGWEEIPQTGTVVIGDDVEVGANTTIDRGALGDTVLEDGVKLDNLIQVAHNVRIGAHTIIAGSAGIAGSARIGARCMIGGASAINGHIEVGDDAVVIGMSMVTQSVPPKGQVGSGLPAQPVRDWRREVARIRRLGQLIARLEALERRAGIERKASQGEDEGGEPNA